MNLRQWAFGIIEFSIALATADTVIVLPLVIMGYPVPSWLYFVPQLHNKAYLAALQYYLHQMNKENNVNLLIVFFFFLISPNGFINALENFTLGVLFGLPIIAMGLAYQLGAPPVVALAATYGAIIFQFMGDMAIVDLLIYLLLGRDVLSLWNS